MSGEAGAEKDSPAKQRVEMRVRKKFQEYDKSGEGFVTGRIFQKNVLQFGR